MVTSCRSVGLYDDEVTQNAKPACFPKPYKNHRYISTLPKMTLRVLVVNVITTPPLS